MPLNAAELLVMLQHSPTAPLRVRLAAALRDAIAAGHLVPGIVLPSTRVLAQDLAISRGVVVDAYAQLAAEGLIRTQRGASTTVAFVPASALPLRGPAVRQAVAAPPAFDLRPGPPDLAAFPRHEWLTATRHVLRDLPSAELGYAEPWGAWALRRELAPYLGRVRGATTSPDGIIIVNGVTQGITLLARLLVEQGRPALAVEDPSNAIQRQLLPRLGVDVVDIPVDDEGLRVDALAASGATTVLCTPAHQYPTGAVLSPRRRAQLLEWAGDTDGIVIEDDYDSEFRYERAPMGCLQGMDPAHVVLLGSVSKTLAPALRLGWIVAPSQLLPAVRRAKRDDDFGSNVLSQVVLAHLVESGAYDRHLRMLRRRYRQRRDAFVEILAQALPDWRVMGSAGGLHLTVCLPDDVAEARLVAAAGANGVAVLGLATMSTSGNVGPGLVLSYARATSDMLSEAISRLAAAVQTHHQVTPTMETRYAAQLPWQEV